MKRVLLLLILTLIPSVSSFSQTVTDTSKVVLSTETARKVIAELIEKDKLVRENDNLKVQVESWKSIDSLSTNQIGNLQTRIEDYKKLLKITDATSEAHRKKVESLEKQLNRSMKTSIVLGTTTVASVLSFIIILIANSEQ